MTSNRTMNALPAFDLIWNNWDKLELMFTDNMKIKPKIFSFKTWMNLSLEAEICSPAAVLRLVMPGGMFLPCTKMMMMMMTIIVMMMMMMMIWREKMIEKVMMTMMTRPAFWCQEPHVSKESLKGPPCHWAAAEKVNPWLVFCGENILKAFLNCVMCTSARWGFEITFTEYHIMGSPEGRPKGSSQRQDWLGQTPWKGLETKKKVKVPSTLLGQTL